MTALLKKIEILPVEFAQDKLELLKNTICKGATNDEFQLFLHVCKRTGLDPFARQIYPVKRPEKMDNGSWRDSMTIQTGIDGFRLIAERTKKYSPGKEPSFQYDSTGNLVSATAYIKKQTEDGTWHEVAATAFYKEYAQFKKDGTLNKFWNKMSHTMLAKCAEALALRKSFPVEMSGVYTNEEMHQADSNIIDETINRLEDTPDDPKEEENRMIQFLQDYPEEDHEFIKNYINKYASHWKKKIIKSIEDYSDKERFLLDFSKWKKRELKRAE